jgi:hypothetical protein
MTCTSCELGIVGRRVESPKTVHRPGEEFRVAGRGMLSVMVTGAARISALRVLDRNPDDRGKARKTRRRRRG